MAGLRNNNNRSWADYMGGILRGSEQINQPVPTHPYLEDIPVLEQMLRDNTQYFLLLTLEEAHHILSDLIGKVDFFFTYRLGAGNIKDLWDGSRNISKLSTWYNEADRLVLNYKCLSIDAKVYKLHGVTYIKITGYPGLRRILKGTRYGTMHPQMVELAIGTRGRFYNLIKGARFCILFSLAWRGIELIFKEDYTLVDFLGDITMDAAKALVSAGIAFVAGGIAVLLGATVIVATGIIIAIGIALNITLNVLDDNYGVSKSLKIKIHEAFEEEFKIRQWHRQHLPYEMYLYYNIRN